MRPSMLISAAATCAIILAATAAGIHLKWWVCILIGAAVGVAVSLPSGKLDD